MTHDSLIFNTDDVILLMATAQYILLAILVLAIRRSGDFSPYLLALILFLTATQSIDSLLTWSSTIRAIVLQSHPNLLFVGSFGYWLQGPLLMFYVKNVLYRKFRFRAIDAVHFIPLVIAIFILSMRYYCLPPQQQQTLMATQELMWEPLIENLISSRYISIIAYASWGLFLLARYRDELQQQYANLEIGERRWLFWVLIGFIVLSGFKLLVHLTGNVMGPHLANYFGIASNYMTYLFVLALVFVSVRYAHQFDGLSLETHTDEVLVFKDEHIERIGNFMSREKPFLDADINIEKLSKMLSIPERTLSKILNQHFDKNFFEFINGYRVEYAKTMLTNSDNPITDTLYESGFKSKSSFNSIFKKMTGMTPSEFRKSLKDV